MTYQQPPHQAQPAYGPPPEPKTPWIHHGIVIALALITCAPVGLLLLCTSRNTTGFTKGMATAVIGGFWVLVFAGIVASRSGARATEERATAASASVSPRQLVAAPVPTQVTLGLSRQVGGVVVECLQFSERAILAMRKENDKKAGEAKPLDASSIKADVFRGAEKKRAKGEPPELDPIDSCPPNPLATCDMREGVTALTYDVDVALDLKKSCKQGWTESAGFEQAVRERPLAISAVNLFKAYEANEVRADNAYKDRKLLVTGKVASIDKDFLNNPVLWLASSNMFQKIMARGLDASVLAELDKGQTVTVLCVGGGLTVGSPVLRDCSLR